MFLSNFSFSDSANRLTNKELTHLLNDGVIVFFFCALMGSIVVDISLSNHEVFDGLHSYLKIKWLVNFVLVGLPILFLIGLCIVYILIVFGNVAENYFQKLSWFPDLLIGFSFVYCYTYKLYNFIEEDAK